MMRLRRLRVWVRAGFLLSMALTTFLATTACAGPRDLSAAPPRTERVFRLGPQAWISMDEHGNVSHAEEPTEPVRPTKKMTGIANVLGAALLGVLSGQNGPYFTRQTPSVQGR
jgi:hypothetical protein